MYELPGTRVVLASYQVLRAFSACCVVFPLTYLRLFWNDDSPSLQRQKRTSLSPYATIPATWRAESMCSPSRKIHAAPAAWSHSAPSTARAGRENTYCTEVSRVREACQTVYKGFSRAMATALYVVRKYKDRLILIFMRKYGLCFRPECVTSYQEYNCTTQQ